MYKNFQKGIFQDLFYDYEGNQEDKTKNSLFDVLAMYIQLYQNLEVRVNDMINGRKLGPK